MVDYALRRRFAFCKMKPEFESKKFSKHLKSKGISESMIEKIRMRMMLLNRVIEEDRDLGDGFLIGHSFFCCNSVPSNENSWYENIINTEIEPLIREYWFDKTDSEIRHKIDQLMQK